MTETGQIFFIELKSKDNEYYTVVDLEVKKLLKDYRPGGIILFKKNIKSLEQTINLINGLQECSDIPLFIGIDEEGSLSRLTNLNLLKFPSGYKLGKLDDTELTGNIARVMGRLLFLLGINLDFAPVLDIADKDKNKMIGDRSFGNNKELVSKHGLSFYKGLQEEKVVSCIKHFPGCGFVEKDLHNENYISNEKYEYILDNNLAPFSAVINEGCSMVMINHSSYTEISSEVCELKSGGTIPVPASLSSEVINGLLQKDMGYNGLVISDSLRMKAVSGLMEPGYLELKCMEAGTDILLMPADMDKAYNKINEEIKNNDKFREKVSNSIEKILKLKEKTGIMDREYEPVNKRIRRIMEITDSNKWIDG